MPIEPRADLEGTQLAGWTPRVTPPADHRVREEADVAVPLPDGPARHTPSAVQRLTATQIPTKGDVR